MRPYIRGFVIAHLAMFPLAIVATFNLPLDWGDRLFILTWAVASFVLATAIWHQQR